MKIWEVHHYDNSFKCLKPKEKWDYNKYKMFDGKKLKGDWNTLEVKEVKIPRKNLILPDVPYFTDGALVVNEKTKETIKNLINHFVEFLPLKYEVENDYWIVNVLNVLNCINFKKAETINYSDGQIMYFKKYSFIEDKVKNEDIFKIIEFPDSCIFVSDRFKEIIETNNITGFTFELVWDSEKE